MQGLSFSIAAEKDDNQQLRGAPFGNPTFIQEMEPGWNDKPVTYNANDAKADIVIVLNQQFYEFMLPYVESFAKENNLIIKVKRGTCGISAGMLSKKSCDIGAFCCPPADTDRLPGLSFHTIGLNPISILVNPENSINDLSLIQIRKIFQGEIRRWSELGWKDDPIKVIARPHCKTRPGHWRLLLNDPDLFGPEVLMVGAIEDMFDLVSTTPEAIGFEVMYQAARESGLVKSLKINGYSPEDLDNLLTRNYPLYRSLYLTTWNEKHLLNPHAQKLIDYIIQQTELHGQEEGILPSSLLRKAGWKFIGDELIGEPN